MLPKLFLAFWLGTCPFIVCDAVILPCLTQERRVDGDDDDTGDDVP